MSAIRELLSIASEPINPDKGASAYRYHHGQAVRDILAMLQSKNGFVAFEAALLVFPATRGGAVPGLESWNREGGWRRFYCDCIPTDSVFFAEDLFGGQFGAVASEIIRFDPESGTVQHYAASLDDWAKTLLANYAEDTGWPLAHEWQLLHGPLALSQRLLPIQPFVLGGDYVVENLVAVDNARAMEHWGRLFQAIRLLPDGETVTVSGWLE